MICKDCIHDGVCFLQEVTNDIDEQLREFGCDDFKNKADFVEVKHGEWIEWYPPKEYILTGEEMLCCCSNCDAKYSDVEGYKFCPYCGAKMDGKEKEVRK